MIQMQNPSVPKHELKNKLKTVDVTGFAKQLDEFKDKYSLQLIEK